LTIYTVRKYRLDIFILISLLIHFLMGYMSGFVPLTSIASKKVEPVKITFLEKKKPVPKPDLTGQVIETPRPRRQEKPRKSRMLSQFNSRMHSRIGAKGSVYRDNRTIIPLNKPRVSTPPPLPPARKRPLHPPKPVREQKFTKALDRAPTARKRYRKPSKFIRKKIVRKRPVSSVIRKKYSDTETKDMAMDATSRTGRGPMFMNTPLLDGTDLEKYARLDTGADKGAAPTADADTISLDTQEFKYVSYFSQIKRKIELVWSYPPEAGRRGLFGKLLLKFTILKDGTLAGLKLLDSTGHEILDNEALRAVKLASPYPPFPKRIHKEKLNIVASFSYYPSFSLVQ